jgi:hypothetical protein
MMQQAKVSTLIQPSQQLVTLAKEYIAAVKRLFDEAKQPDFSEANWSAAAALVEVNEFVWVSAGCEKLNWQDYVAYLSEWARVVRWESTLMRMHQWQDSVFVEQEERCTLGDTVDVLRMVAVFDFNDAGKIKGVSVFMQHKPSLGL